MIKNRAHLERILGQIYHPDFRVAVDQSGTAVFVGLRMDCAAIAEPLPDGKLPADFWTPIWNDPPRRMPMTQIYAPVCSSDFPDDQDAEMVRATVRTMIEMAVHETQEHIRIGGPAGKRLFNPHTRSRTSGFYKVVDETASGGFDPVLEATKLLTKIP